MLRGKRPRPSMRRTTSLTEFTVDLTHIEPPPAVPAPARSDQSNNNNYPYYPNIKDGEPNHPNYPNTKDREAAHLARRNTVSGGDTNNFLLSMVSPRNQRRNSTDFTVETPHFLRACGLCQRSLRPGRDIYMYRGDTAFCSSECRQQQMNHDERKEKCSVASKKEIQPSTVSRSETSSKGESVAAA